MNDFDKRQLLLKSMDALSISYCTVLERTNSKEEVTGEFYDKSEFLFEYDKTSFYLFGNTVYGVALIFSNVRKDRALLGVIVAAFVETVEGDETLIFAR